MLIIRHKVKDYSKWRPAFDRHVGAQKLAGLTNPRLLRSADDKNELMIVFDTKDMKTAKAFAAFPRLKDAMREAGVVDSPTVYFPKWV